MKDCGNGLYEVEQEDSPEIARLHEHVEALVQQERDRLNEKRGHAWWADVVFYVHDMMSFTSLMRNHYEAQDVANLVIETTTITGKKLIGHALGVQDEEKLEHVWRDILHDAHALDDLVRERVDNDPVMASMALLADAEGWKH